MTDLNEAGRAYARSLIAAGKIDRTSGWDFSADDGNALLGTSGDDWTSFAKVHLGVDTSATDKTKARWKYPVAKGGKVYRAGVIAAKQRASAQGDSAVEAATGELLEKIDADKKSGASLLIETKFTPWEFKFTDDSGDEPGTFEGYGAVFGNEDDYGDVIQQGAFDKTLAKSKATGRMPKMLLNHGGVAPGFNGATPESMLPIGKWNAIAPDAHGLQAKGKLINLDTDHGKRVYGAMKEGELSDLSIGYIPREFVRGTKANEPRRTITGLDLHEISPATFAANDQANITAVKSLALLGGYDMRDLEATLRDGGLSRSDAVKAIAAFKTFFQRDAGRPDPSDREGPRDAATSDDLRELASRLRAAAAA